MMNLEQVLLMYSELTVSEIEAEALAAARLDCDAAYWRGVEDRRILTEISFAETHLNEARRCLKGERGFRRNGIDIALRAALRAMEEAFRLPDGTVARGAERAAIRQRLEAIRQRGK